MPSGATPASWMPVNPQRFASAIAVSVCSFSSARDGTGMTRPTVPWALSTNTPVGLWAESRLNRPRLARAGDRQGAAVAAHERDPPGAHHDCLDDRPIHIGGVDLGVRHHQIRLLECQEGEQYHHVMSLGRLVSTSWALWNGSRGPRMGMRCAIEFA